MQKRAKIYKERRQNMESLLDSYGDTVWNLTLALTGNQDLAQALFIEAFLDIDRKLFYRKWQTPNEAWVLRRSVRAFDELLKPLVNSEHRRSAKLTMKKTLEPRSSHSQAQDAKTATALGAQTGMAYASSVVASHLDEEELNRLVQWVEGLRRRRAGALQVTVQELLAALPAQASVPAEMRIRLSHLLYAVDAEMEAQRRHSGPTWTKYALPLTFVFAMGTVGYGLYRPVSHPAVASSAAKVPTNDSQQQLPAPLQNLPVTVVGQFKLNSGFDKNSLRHMVLTKNMLYLPVLQQSSDTWPSIVLQSAPLTQAGQGLPNALKNVAAIDLIPPLTPPKSAKAQTGVAGLGWRIADWNLYVTGEWAIAAVRWDPVHSSSGSITQLYALYLPSGVSSLAKLLNDAPNNANSYTVAVGGGKVAIQTGFKTPTAGNTEVSLPVDVYTLSGTSPARALGQPKHLPAPFGVMVNPVITGNTLVFQGIQGHTEPSGTTTATWYQLSWTGQVGSLTGPPLDGQPHWAVRGASGQLWWVETTPDMNQKGFVQVLMGPLAAPGSQTQSPAQTLSKSVRFVRVSDQDLAWVQTDGSVDQLVVTQVQ